MKIGKTLYLTTREEWKNWLEINHNKEKEIWLIYYKKASNKPRIPYNVAVEEALAYGWIDGILKSIDKEQFAQRFTPRRSNSNVSEINKERVRRLIKKKRMTDAGLKAITHAFDPNNDNEELVIPSDILKRLKANKDVWENFQKFSESYKRIRIAYIKTQGKHSKELYESTLKNFIKMTAKNKKFGMIQ